MKQLRESKSFLKHIRWDITPRIFFQPRFAKTANIPKKTDDDIEGYMFYVDEVFRKPAVVIMRIRELMSRTVGYIDEVPEDLLSKALHCSEEECISGMYPLTEEIEHWLKRELGLS
jgi:hypothetical protein